MIEKPILNLTETLLYVHMLLFPHTREGVDQVTQVDLDEYCYTRVLIVNSILTNKYLF